MSELKIAGNPLPGMPWEERPEGCKNVMWRCSANPIIPRDLLPTSNSIFNSAVVPFGEGYAGVFRCPLTVHLISKGVNDYYCYIILPAICIGS